jgi:chromosome segregation ATPase
MKNEVQKQLDDTNNRIKGEEEAKAQIQAQGGKVRQEADRLRGEVKELEANLEQCEEDKVRSLGMMMRVRVRRRPRPRSRPRAARSGRRLTGSGERSRSSRPTWSSARRTR